MKEPFRPNVGYASRVFVSKDKKYTIHSRTISEDATPETEFIVTDGMLEKWASKSDYFIFMLMKEDNRISKPSGYLAVDEFLAKSKTIMEGEPWDKKWKSPENGRVIKVQDLRPHEELESILGFNEKKGESHNPFPTLSLDNPDEITQTYNELAKEILLRLKSHSHDNFSKEAPHELSSH